MLLLHTVLAVVCGELLVSARPEPIRGRDWHAENADFTDTNVPSYQVEQSASAEFDDAWEWAPQGPQYILGTPPHHAGGFPFPDQHWPESPHPFPEPPQRDPEPPQFPPQYPPEPHYPPPCDPPGAPPPPKETPHFPHHPPHFPKPDDDTKEQTVYQFLEGHPKFSRLFKLVNYTEDITNYLNDSSQSVSFFALPDFGFPKQPHHHDGDNDGDLFQMHEGSLGDMLAAAEGYLNRASRPDEGRVKAFIKYVLLYNILPEHTPLHELGKNNTFATALKLPDGSLDGKPLRVRVKRNIGLDPRPSVNFVSKILVPDIPVKNGVVHIVNKPILPPPSIFQIGFLLSDAFSTFTSALQRVGLTDELDLRSAEDGSVEGSPAVSVFAPTNKAFSRLPHKLKLFLFSPFGEKALKKLLQFHIVPKAVLHSDYFHNASQSGFVLSRDTSEASEFYAQLDHRPEAWFAVLGEPSYLEWAGFNHEDAYESNEWREANLNWEKPSPWENGCQCTPTKPFHHEAPRNAPHSPYAGDAHPPQHHGAFPWPPPPRPPPPRAGLLRPHYPSPPPPPYPGAWPHYRRSPPPPPPHHPKVGPHHPPHFPPPPPPNVWVHYHSPPPPSDDPHHPPRFPPPPPPFEHRPHHPPFPPPPDRSHGQFPHPPPPPPGKVPKGGPPHHHPEVVHSVNATVPTLLENHSLEVKVVQVAFRGPHPKPSFYETFIVAHGQAVAVADVPARNGAIHVITKLLNPLKKPGHHHGHEEERDKPAFGSFIEEEEDEWAGWEEWLPVWAEEQN